MQVILDAESRAAIRLIAESDEDRAVLEWLSENAPVHFEWTDEGASGFLEEHFCYDGN